jgi:hypothetical protein
MKNNNYKLIHFLGYLTRNVRYRILIILITICHRYKQL